MAEMLYRPKLENGKNVPLSWPIAFYRKINNVCWPLEDDVSMFTRIFDRYCYILFLVIYLLHFDAELRFLSVHFNDLEKVLEGVIVTVVDLDMALRTLQLGKNKQHFKQFLQKFYTDIYIQKSVHPQLFRSIKKKLRPTIVYSVLYLFSLILYAGVPFISLISNRRDLAFPMITTFDLTPLNIYFPLACSSAWISFVMVSMLFGDMNIMSEAMLHLHGQYLMLDEELQSSSKELLRQADGEAISRAFIEKLKHIMQRNGELKKFGDELQKFFSYRIFLMYAFAAMIICILGYKTYTNNTVIYNDLWMLSKVAEMLTIGEIGSTLHVTSNNVSSMYYNSNWELIISCSTNTRENIRLMKLLLMAIETNQKPFDLKGLSFFRVSVTTVVKILQAAGSYFTCLVSVHEN